MGAFRLPTCDDCTVQVAKYSGSALVTCCSYLVKDLVKQLTKTIRLKQPAIESVHQQLCIDHQERFIIKKYLGT